MKERVTAESFQAELQAGLAEDEAQIAAMERAGPGDVAAVLDVMARALQPGDDPGSWPAWRRFAGSSGW